MALASCFANKYLFLLNKILRRNLLYGPFGFVLSVKLGPAWRAGATGIAERDTPLSTRAVHHGCPLPLLRPGCVQVIARPRFALSAAGPFNGARSGRMSGTRFVTAPSGAGAIKKPPIDDRRIENWCRSSHHPAHECQQGAAKRALFATPSIGLVCGFAQAPYLVSSMA